jgi:hypothetical protein
MRLELCGQIQQSDIAANGGKLAVVSRLENLCGLAFDAVRRYSLPRSAHV